MVKEEVIPQDYKMIFVWIFFSIAAAACILLMCCIFFMLAFVIVYKIWNKIEDNKRVHPIEQDEVELQEDGPPHAC